MPSSISASSCERSSPRREPDTNLNEIPVHVGKVTTETLHRYIDGYGMVAPRRRARAR